MTNYSPESQMNFSIQWFKGWSDFQKDDFVTILAQKIGGPSSNSAVNGLVNGMTQLDTSSGRPPSLFSCQVLLIVHYYLNQKYEIDRKCKKSNMRIIGFCLCIKVKLFSEWWDSWSESDKDKMKGLLKEADVKFWDTLEEEMNGTRGKLDEDFMIVTCSGESNDVDDNSSKVGSGDAPAPIPVFKVKQIVTGSSIASATSDLDEEISNNVDESVRDPEDTNGGGVEKNGHESPTSPVATEI